MPSWSLGCTTNLGGTASQAAIRLHFSKPIYDTKQLTVKDFSPEISHLSLLSQWEVYILFWVFLLCKREERSSQNQRSILVNKKITAGWTTSSNLNIWDSYCYQHSSSFLPETFDSKWLNTLIFTSIHTPFPLLSPPPPPNHFFQPSPPPHLGQWAGSGAPQPQPGCVRCRCSCRCASAWGWRYAGSWWSLCCLWWRRGWPGLAGHPSARWWRQVGRQTLPHKGWRLAGRWKTEGTQMGGW